MQLALRIVGLAARLLLALGLICLLLGGYLAWQTLSFASTAQSATGRVVSYHEIAEDGQKRFRPRVRFKTPDGSIHTITGQLAYTARRYPVGTALPVVYQAALPGEARIATFTDNWLGVAIAGAVGLVSLLAGLFVRRSRATAA
jgi:hypothetical protein